MKHVICIDKDDIKTAVIGNNFWIEATPELSISFTVDAVEEFLKDYEAWKGSKAVKADLPELKDIKVD